jgi:hypothetical protein
MAKRKFTTKKKHKVKFLHVLVEHEQLRNLVSLINERLMIETLNLALIRSRTTLHGTRRMRS